MAKKTIDPETEVVAATLIAESSTARLESLGADLDALLDEVRSAQNVPPAQLHYDGKFLTGLIEKLTALRAKLA